MSQRLPLEFTVTFPSEVLFISSVLHHADKQTTLDGQSVPAEPGFSAQRFSAAVGSQDEIILTFGPFSPRPDATLTLHMLYQQPQQHAYSIAAFGEGFQLTLGDFRPDAASFSAVLASTADLWTNSVESSPLMPNADDWFSSNAPTLHEDAAPYPADVSSAQPSASESEDDMTMMPQPEMLPEPESAFTQAPGAGVPERKIRKVKSSGPKRAPEPTLSGFPVWYATNRQPTYDPNQRLTGFSAEIAPAVSYGKCLVHIPEGHEIGETQSGFWRRVLLTLTFRKDDQALRLLGNESQDEATYWADIQAAAAQWADDERCALVFLHGYNVSFEEAAIRAAQIGYDLQVRGPVGFFSWPSQGSLMGYPADESAIESSEDEITQYLRDFAVRCGAERIHVIAHSMGNRGLLRAIQRIVAGAAADAPKLFEHFILAAPDVDQALFLNLADNYGRLARRTTLYVSNKDLALASSRMLRTGMARAGLAPPVTIVPHIDTVHVANVDMTLLGHGYVAEAREVLADMHQLLYHNADPSERMGLRPAEQSGVKYWVIGA